MLKGVVKASKLLSLTIAAALSLAGFALSGCSSGSNASAIDTLFGAGSNAPVLSGVPTQVVQQTQKVLVDVNNVKKSTIGDDKDMKYSCSWQRVTGAAPTSAADCATLPNGSATFDGSSGIFQWTPSTAELGQFKISIVGSNQGGTDTRDFTVDVRLLFAGLESLSNIQGDRMTLNWTPNPLAAAYNVMRKNADGSFGIFQTITVPTQNSVTLLNLTPQATYTFKVQAVDTLGFLDGNNVTLSAVTADLIRLQVTAAAAKLSPGQSTTVTVRLKDNNGNYLSTSGLTVGVALSGNGTSSGTFSAVNDLGNGAYTATFTATSPGTADTITASLTQFFFVEQTAPMQVMPLQVEITSSAAKVNPNLAITLTARVRDFNGLLVSTGGHGLQFTYAGGTSTASISAALDLGTGTYTATLTGGTAGTTVTLGATLSTTSTIYSTATVQVVPYSIEVTSLLTDLSVTRSTSVSARVKDWQGNYLTTGGQSLVFAVSGSTGILNMAGTTDNNNGTYTAIISGLSLGTVVVTASMNPSYAVTQTATVTVRKLRLEFLSSASHLMPLQVATLTGRVKDWQGNLVGVGGQAMDFSASAGTSSGTIGTIVDNGNGTYSSTFTAGTAGTALTVSGSISDTYQVDLTASITVEKWRVYITTSSPTIQTGQSVTATVTVKDYLDVQAVTGGQTVTLQTSGGTSTVNAGVVNDNANGTYTSTVLGVTTGTATTITASLNQSYQVISTATLAVGSIYLKITTDTPQMNPGGTGYVYAQITDSVGANLTAGSYSISFSYSGGTSTGSFGAVSYQGNGLYRAQFTGSNGGTAVTVTASASSTYAVSSTATIVVTPWSLKITAGATAITVGQATTLTGKVYDYTGALVTSGGKGFAMAMATSGIGSLSAVTDNNDGTYTSTFTATDVGSTSINANITSSFVVTSTVTIVTNSLHIAVTVASSQMNPGGTSVVSAQLKDASGNAISGAYSINFSYTGGTSTGTFSTVTNQGGGLYSSTFTGATGGTAITITAASATTAFTVDSAQTTTVVPWSVKITAPATAVTVGQSVVLTARIYDYNGVAKTTGGLGVTESLATAGVGSLSAVTDNTDGTYTATFSASGVGSTAVNASMPTSYTLDQTVTLTTTAVQLLITASQSQMNPGGTAYVYAQIQNASNQNLNGAGYTISFGTSGGTSTGSFSATTYLGSGLYRATFTGNGGGTAQTITATSGAYSYTTVGTPTITVVPWSLKVTAASTTVTVGQSTTVVAKVYDYTGAQVANGGQSVSLSLATSSVGSLSGVVDNADGSYTTTFSATNTGSSSINASMSASYTLTSTVTITTSAIYLATSVGAPKMNPGGSTYVYIQTQDASANPISGGNYSLSFSASGGTSTGAFGAITSLGAGLYRATFTGATGGTAITISASSATYSFTLATTQTITVVPWSIKLTTSASALTVGLTAAVTAKVYDYNGTQLTTGGQGLSLSLVTSGIGSFSAVTDNGNGSYSSTFSATGVGSTDVTASMSASYTVDQIVTFTTTAVQLAISVSATQLNPAGTVYVYAQAKDSLNNNISGAGYSVSFATSGGTSTGAFSATTYLGSGQYRATFTGQTGGTALTVSATSSSFTFTTTGAPTITVVPWSIKVTSSASALTVGQTATLTARVYDFNDVQVTSGSQGLALSLADSSVGNLSAVTDNHDGSYSASFSASGTGSSVVNASLSSSYNVTTTVTFTTTAVQLLITVQNAQMNPGGTSYVYAQVRDSGGTVLSGAGYSINFSASGGTSTGSFSAVTYQGSGLYRATFTGSNGGTALTIAASSSVYAFTTSGTPTITVVPWSLRITSSATAVNVGQTVTLTGRIYDYTGTQVTSGGQSLSMSLATSGIGSLSSVTDNNDGSYTSVFSASGTGSTSINASISSSYTLTSTVTLNSTAVTLVVTVQNAQMNPAGTSYVYAQVQDGAGNNLSGSGYSISFATSGGTSTGTFSAVTYQGSGQYRAVFTGSTGGTALTISASSATYAYVVSGTPTITVVPWSIQITSSSSSVNVGQSVTLTAKVYDYTGAQRATGGQGLSLAAATSGIGTFGAVTDVGDGSYTTVFSATATGSTAITASMAASYSVTSTVTLTSSAVTLVVSVQNTQMNPAGTSYVYAQLQDGAGNNINGAGYSISFATSGGTSTGTFSAVTYQTNGLYRATFTGATGGSATTITAASATYAYNISGTPTITVVPWSLKITASATAVTVGQSPTLTGKVYDYTGALVTTGGKGFAMSAATTGIGTLNAVTDNNDGTYTASFSATAVGSTSINGTISSSFTLTSTVTIVSTAVHLYLSASQNSLNPGDGVTITALVRDASGNNLLSSGYTIGFTYSGGTSTGSLSGTVNLGTGAYTSVFNGNVAGTATLITANASVPFVVDQTVSETVVPWDIRISATATAYSIYETGTITALVKNWQGTTVTTGGKGLSLALSAAGVGSISATTDNNDGTYAANFQATAVGSVTVTANMSQSFTTTVTPTLTVAKVYLYVTVGAGLTSTSIQSNGTVTATVTLKNAGGVTVSGTGYVITLGVAGGTATLVADTSMSQVSPGIYQITYHGVAAGTATTLTASANVTYTSSQTAAVTVTPSTVISAGNSTLVTSATSVRSAGSPATLTATMKDANGNLITGLTGVSFTASTGAGVGTGTVSTPTTEIGGGQYTATFTGGAQGLNPAVITASSGGVSVATTVSITVTSGVPSKLTLTGPSALTAGDCSYLTGTAYKFSFADSANNPTTLASDTTFTVSGLGYGVLFRDTSCATPITTFTVTSGSADSGNFYMKTYAPATYTLSFVDSGATMTQTNAPTTVVSSILSWLGALGTIDLNAGPSVSPAYAHGYFDGGFNLVQGVSVAVEGSNTYLYAHDNSQHSIQKFDITSGAGSIVSKGAFGRIGSSVKALATGGTNSSYCTGLGVGLGVGTNIGGNTTAGPCTGAQYQTGNTDGAFNASYRSTVMNIGGVNYMFATDSGNNRIMKYNADTGVFIGWSGLIGANTNTTSPGGASLTGACATAYTNAVAGGATAGAGYGFGTTPTWCTGGTSQASVSTAAVPGTTQMGNDGTAGNYLYGGNQFRTPTYITNDGTYLYIVDQGNNRIVVLNPTTGGLVRWMGRIASTALTSASNNQNGMTWPNAISCLTNTQSDGTSTNATGTYTASWCVGGASVSTAISIAGYTNAFVNAQLNAPRAIGFYADSNYNYMVVTDAGTHRLQRYICGTATATPNCAGSSSFTVGAGTYWPGNYWGWTGLVATNATNTAAVPTGSNTSISFPGRFDALTSVATNGWVYAGGSTSSATWGALSSPIGLVVTGGKIYIADANNLRLEKVDAVTGTFNGWIGRVSQTPTGGPSGSGCAGANAGSITQGWCYGGTATQGAQVGAFGTLYDVTTDGTNLYVADRDNFRVSIHSIATGTPVGAIGLRATTQPSVWSTTSFALNTAMPVNTGFNNWYAVPNRDKVLFNPDQTIVQGNYMYVADSGNNRIKRYKWLDGSFQGWIGLTFSLSPTGGDDACVGAIVGGFTPGWCQGGGFAASTTFGFTTPRGLASDGTYLYVADTGNHRLVRIALSDGSFQGWFGLIATVPSDNATGSSNCASASVGAITPGWCLGGAAAATLTNSSSNPNVNSFVVGGFSSPAGLSGYLDASDGKYYLIVGDTNNNRLQRLLASSPATSPTWIGLNYNGTNSGTATGVGTYCSTAAGQATTSWCSQSGVETAAQYNVWYNVTTTSSNYVNNATVFQPRALYVDNSTTSTPVVYVGTGNGRLMKFNARSGAFIGWVGLFGGSLGANAAGAACMSGANGGYNNSAYGTYQFPGGSTSTLGASLPTPSWCTGATYNTTSTIDGGFNGTIGGVYSDGTYVYASDTNNFRIMKYYAATGQYIGWVGRVGVTSPTAGPAGTASAACSGTALNSITPDWCTGGTWKGGYTMDFTNKKSAFDTPIGITGVGSYLMINDYANGRIISMPSN